MREMQERATIGCRFNERLEKLFTLTTHMTDKEAA